MDHFPSPSARKRSHGDMVAGHDRSTTPTDNKPDLDPSAALEPYDWEDVAQRYHADIQELRSREDEILAHYSDLLGFFSLWVNASRTHEVDRTFNRLRTRTTHVQYSEEELEEKRQHYIRVVNAFESALKLLNA
ncbi:uncharacterized protein K452DRAFT_294187 [Aplosporella prunicola CBS 121167]|uniref:Uncharacterized protein n=1 Tax=Aplosporella prunicola CBS 121167 TaxID=1176127 RepID=A0A6A6BTU2_9PEZI|nr:uncharacterized protein K452DRAFT_294187 [Aplosporella prunicola CBS 121167]KAF2146634.1 hypothetical protein K452DRAFT_294187 [Aplosporella prunicola CBS 121167]